MGIQYSTTQCFSTLSPPKGRMLTNHITDLSKKKEKYPSRNSTGGYGQGRIKYPQ